MRNTLSVGAIIAALAFSASAAKAEVFTWTVDSSLSYARLTFPDQVITYSGITASVRPRSTTATGTTGSGAANAWTDTNGRKASLGGTFQADYVTDGLGGTYLTFNNGSNILGLNTPGLLAAPDPANWDGTSFTPTGSALANFSSKVYLNAGFGLINANIALAIRQAVVDLNSAQLLLGGGTTIAGNSTNIGLSQGGVQVKGTAIGSLATIPDVNTSFTSTPVLNTGGGVVNNLGGLSRQIDLLINIPVNLEVTAGVTVTASISGRIVGTATVPEVGSTMLVALGLMGVGVPVAIRRRRAS